MLSSSSEVFVGGGGVIYLDKDQPRALCMKNKHSTSKLRPILLSWKSERLTIIPLGGKSMSPDVSPIKLGLCAWTLCLYIGLEVFVMLGASGL